MTRWKIRWKNFNNLIYVYIETDPINTLILREIKTKLEHQWNTI